MTFRNSCTRGIAAAILTAILAVPAAAQDPATAPDDTWISVSGTVASVSPDMFLLNYDSGTIRVEMDDDDREADAYKLMPGDTVTVNGVIDDDFLDVRSIEARSVYVANVGTTFFAGATSKDAWWGYVPSSAHSNSTVLEGTVTDVGDDEFMLDLGMTRLEVEVDEMTYNPLDDEGFQRIRVGDRVRTTGQSDYDLFEGRVFDASSVVILRKARSRN